MKIVLISGLSGSGKSLALKQLQKMGFQCVDNLPPALLPQLVEQYASGRGRECNKLAVSLDIRGQAYTLDKIRECMGQLRQSGHRVSLLFLNATDEWLMRSFAQSHRSHPLSVGRLSLAESIEAERAVLTAWREAGLLIDNQGASPQELAYRIQDTLAGENAGLSVALESFGFKYGAPLNQDFVFDVRSLPNPYYDKDLRPFTGRDEPVRAYLAQFRVVQQMVADISSYLNRWLPEMAKQSNIRSVTVGIGCTGGHHRSVFVVEAVAERLREYPVWVRHRQLLKAEEPPPA